MHCDLRFSLSFIESDRQSIKATLYGKLCSRYQLLTDLLGGAVGGELVGGLFGLNSSKS